MELHDRELAMAKYAMRLAISLMENHITDVRSKIPADRVQAKEKELRLAKELLERLNKDESLSIHPFTNFPTIFDSWTNKLDEDPA